MWSYNQVQLVSRCLLQPHLHLHRRLLLRHGEAQLGQLSQLLHEHKRQDGMRARTSQSAAGPYDSEVSTYVNRSHAGVQPFMRNCGPSSRRPARIICASDLKLSARSPGLLWFRSLTAPPAALWILLFNTSAGAQMVVATVPATKDDMVCVLMSSLSPMSLRKNCLAVAYLALWLGRRSNVAQMDYLRCNLADICVAC